jgi:hypothetical protein
LPKSKNGLPLFTRSIWPDSDLKKAVGRHDAVVDICVNKRCFKRKLGVPKRQLRFLDTDCRQQNHVRGSGGFYTFQSVHMSLIIYGPRILRNARPLRHARQQNVKFFAPKAGALQIGKFRDIAITPFTSPSFERVPLRRTAAKGDDLMTTLGKAGTRCPANRSGCAKHEYPFGRH